MVILIRHGETDSNLLNKGGYQFVCGQYESQLTAKGRGDAACLSAEFKDFDGRVFCSDLQRTVETACLIFPCRRIEVTPLLRERSLGIYEGRTVSELQEQIPGFDLSRFLQEKDSFDSHLEGAENYRDVERRVTKFWNGICYAPGEDIAIVSHSCTIKLILKVLLGLTEADTFKQRVACCTPIFIR